MSNYYKNDSGPHPYPWPYLNEICETQEELFMLIRDELPGVDEKWFIGAYMRSKARLLLDRGNPILANRSARELAYTFIHEECGGHYPRGDEWGGFLPGWTGHIYALYQWLYATPSAEVIEWFPLEAMEAFWRPYHTICYEAAVEKLHFAREERQKALNGG